MAKTRADREREEQEESPFPDAEEQERRDEERRREITEAANIASGGRAGKELLIDSDERKAKLDEAEKGRKEREKAEKEH